MIKKFYRCLSIWFVFCLSFFTSFLYSDPLDSVPVSYQGRFMPLASVMKLESDDRLNLSLEHRLYSFSNDNDEVHIWHDMEIMQKKGATPKEITLELEHRYSLSSRLANIEGYKILPGRFQAGQWYSLPSLQLKTFDSKTQKLTLVKNFTLYPDSLFASIRSTYFKMIDAFSQKKTKEFAVLENTLARLLNEGYATLAGTAFHDTAEKNLSYPSFGQLHAEKFYTRAPLLFLTISGYFLVLLLFLLGIFLKRPWLLNWAFGCFIITFCCHSLLLLLRIYILWRPPVANMVETLLYVPWITSAASLILRFNFPSFLPIIASTFASLILLSLSKVSFNTESLENIPAVLNSHYWLLIHVLMVVGSYGLFLLASVLGHFYLIGYAYHNQETPILNLTAKVLIITLYVGVILLVGGTLLGGVWAAQSWGRFWDWDPKESWAFISICVYVLWIHLYRFHKIHNYGLAFGAIFGFLAISFTWYGVNYLLGIGLHSYGFGSGGTLFYYSYLLGEMIFSATIIGSYRFSKNIDKKPKNC